MAEWKGRDAIMHDEEGDDRGVTLTSINLLPKVLRLNACFMLSSTSTREKRMAPMAVLQLRRGEQQGNEKKHDRVSTPPPAIRSTLRKLAASCSHAAAQIDVPLMVEVVPTIEKE
jgi:hypothetical protein